MSKLAFALLFISQIAFAGLLLQTPQNGGFTPAKLSLLLWEDGADATQINSGSPTSGDSVTTWKDKGPGHHNFVQNGSNPVPTYQTNIKNGHSCVDFSTVGSATLVNSDNFLVSGSTPFTIFVVAKRPTIAASSFAFLMTFHGAGSGNDPQFGFSTTTGYTNLFFGAMVSGGTYNSARSSATFGTDSTFYEGAVTYDGSGIVAGYQFYSANTSETTISASDDTGTSALNIMGANNVAGVLNINGPICDFVIENGVASSTDRSNMHTYFVSKWGSTSP